MDTKISDKCSYVRKKKKRRGEIRGKKSLVKKEGEVGGIGLPTKK
jgi:hypothetical protein